jgi:hypothetical protein
MNKLIAITATDWIEDLQLTLQTEPLGTVKVPARVMGIWNRVAGSRREFARIEVLAEPATTWSVEDQVPYGSLGEAEPHRESFLRSAILGILDVLAISTRPPILNVRIVLEGAKASPTDSNDEAFRQAGRHAARKLLGTVRPRLAQVEPPATMTQSDRERMEWHQRVWEEGQRHQVYRADLLEKLMRALYETDPIGLAATGAPQDEYQPEAGTILSRLPEAANVDDVQRIVREELIRWFGTWWLTWNPTRAEAIVDQCAHAVWKTWIDNRER